MRILDKPIAIIELKEIAQNMFGDLVKAVIDVDLKRIAINAELHSDLEALMLENGSKQNSLWGINYYPDLEGDDFIEFDSMINMRPSQGNTSRGVDSEVIRNIIIQITNEWIKK